MSFSPDCPLLSLPVELRLHIYSLVLVDCRQITLGIAKLEGDYADIVQRQYGGSRSPFPGIPNHHEPVIEAGYCAPLLSPLATGVYDLKPIALQPAKHSYLHIHTPYHTLSLLCKQINLELETHFTTRSQRETNVFAQYPHGLHVLRTLTPKLLQYAKTVHLAGFYRPSNLSSHPAACVRPGPVPTEDRPQGNVVPNPQSQLGGLVKSLFGPKPIHPVSKFELRVYYPGDDSYNVVWNDESSPTVIALRNIAIADIRVEIWRGRHSTGVCLTAKPATTGKRTVTTVWRRLEEGRCGQPPCGSWVINPLWPEWKDDHEIADGSSFNTIAEMSSF